MRVKIRFYRPHDMDLIALKRSDSYKLGSEIKRCLIAYATSNEYTPPAFSFSEENKDGYVGKYYQMHIELNPKKPEEKAAIDILSDIRPGYRCAFLKTLFRSSCPYLPLLVFADNNGLATSKMEAFIQKTERKSDTDKVDPQNIESNTKESTSVVSTNVESTDNSDTKSASNDTEDFDALFAGFAELGHQG